MSLRTTCDRVLRLAGQPPLVETAQALYDGGMTLTEIRDHLDERFGLDLHTESLRRWLADEGMRFSRGPRPGAVTE